MIKAIKYNVCGGSVRLKETLVSKATSYEAENTSCERRTQLL